MRKINLLAGIFLFTIIVSSCDDILNTSTDAEIAAELEGQWKCDETSSQYKSTSDNQSPDVIYDIYIYLSDTDSTLVHIDNFYELGNNVTASARVSGSSITLINEELDGFTVRGSGTLSSDLKTITWLYYVDDGSGDTDEVSATYTFVY